MPEPTADSLGRRDFLAATAGVAIPWVRPAQVSSTAAQSAIRLGLIGCGGRGRWIAPLFMKHGGYRLVACADYFPDRAEAVGQQWHIGASQRYSGLSGYKRLLEAPVDAVVIESPPGFHPEQAGAAVEAGKHVFLAKLIAVDVPGCQTIAQCGKKATETKRVMLVDFQTRADPRFREAVARVHRGDLGRLVCGEAHYPWSGGGPGAPIHSPEERLRLWYFSLDLCGDVIVEQDIHALDVATWIVGADPIRASGLCGRAIRKYGQISDHFIVTYWFPNDFVLSFTSVKCIPGVRDEIRCRIFGTEGVIDTDYFGDVAIRGNKPYQGGPSDPSIASGLYLTGTVNNIAEFHRAITAGDFTNPTVAPSVRSNLTCILGRTAAYEKRMVTWEEMLRANQRIELDLRGLKS